MRLNVNILGADDIIKKFGSMADKALNVSDKVTETYTRNMANTSGQLAPVESGDLRNSIIASPKRIKVGVWEYGSTLQYARRQEYEHKSKKGFIRRSVWKNREAYREALRREMTKL